MAIDFSNKATPGSTDPNALVSVTPKKSQYWIKTDADGAWQGIPTNNPAVANQPGYHSVGVATVLLNDGRQYLAVLDGEGKPISEVGDPIEPDTTQAQSFNQNKSTTKAPNGQQYSRGPDGSINEWNPNSNPPGYNIPHPEMSPAGAIRSPEAKANDEALNAQRQKNASLPKDQDPRWETDAERDARAEAKRVEQRAQEGQARQRTIDEQNAATAAAASRRADSAEARAIAEANKVGSKVEDLTIQGQHYTKITKTSADGKSTSIENYGPDGALIATLPTEKKPGQMVTVGGDQYWAAPNADPSQPPTLTRIDPSGNKQPTDNGPQFTPGMSPSEYLNARRTWLMEQRRAGVSQKDIDAYWDRDVQIASSKQNEANTAATQQNQRLSSATTGFGQAMTSATEINKYLPVGSDLGGRFLEATLGLQRGQAQRMGAYGDSGASGRLTVPSAPTAPDPSNQVAAVPAAPASNAAVGSVAQSAPTSTSAAGAGLDGNERPDDVLTFESPVIGRVTKTRAEFDALPPEHQSYLKPMLTGAAPSTPPAVQGAPSQVGDTGAAPVSLAPQQSATVAAIPESPYDFAQRIASMPPWKLSEEDHRKAQEMGMGREFWSTGSAAA